MIGQLHGSNARGHFLSHEKRTERKCNLPTETKDSKSSPVVAGLCVALRCSKFNLKPVNSNSRYIMLVNKSISCVAGRST